MNLRKRKKFIAFFLILTLFFSCGWEDDDDDSILGAFLAGCITGLLFGSFARDHDHHHYRRSGRATRSRSHRPAPSRSHGSAPKSSGNYKHPLTK